MLNPNLDSLRKIHGDKAESVFREIADLGGFGNVDVNYAGGLDVAGVLNDSNTALSSREKDRIAELCGESRRESFETNSSVVKMPKDKETK